MRAKRKIRRAEAGFAVKLEVHPLSPEALGALSERMVKAKTVKKGDRLEAELVKGFYGAVQGSK